jgi:hypothetical protein
MPAHRRLTRLPVARLRLAAFACGLLLTGMVGTANAAPADPPNGGPPAPAD